MHPMHDTQSIETRSGDLGAVVDDLKYAFEAFKETSLFDKATAESFRRNVLARNGTADFMKMFVDFRGREPRIEPLLKNRGLTD